MKTTKKLQLTKKTRKKIGHVKIEKVDMADGKVMYTFYAKLGERRTIRDQAELNSLILRQAERKRGKGRVRVSSILNDDILVLAAIRKIA